MKKDMKKDRLKKKAAAQNAALLRDEARRLVAENAVLRGDVATTEIDVERIETYRADRVYLVGRLGGPTYLGRALDGQKKGGRDGR